MVTSFQDLAPLDENSGGSGRSSSRWVSHRAARAAFLDHGLLRRRPRSAHQRRRRVQVRLVLEEVQVAANS